MACIKKRENRDGSSSYNVRWWEAGKPHQQAFRRSHDAKTFKTEVENRLLRGEVTDPKRGRELFSQVAARWLTTDGLKRASSKERDGVILRLHILPILGHRPIKSISKIDVQALVGSWAKRYVATTVGRHFTTLQAVFSFAAADDLITRTPCRDIRLPRPTLADRPRFDPVTIDTVVDALGHDGGIARLAIMGLRWAEAAGLTANRIDLEAGTITVDQQLSRRGNLEPTKTSNRRTFRPDTATMDALKKQLAHRGLTTEDHELLFVDSRGGPLRYSNWRRRAWKPACEHAGAPHLRMHDLRSNAATALVAAGVDVKTAQNRLGHANPQTTLRIYARATDDADARAAAALDDLFSPRA